VQSIELLSELAANRAAYFSLVKKLEAATGREVDELKLECRIDSDFDGRKQVTEKEARSILRTAASRRRKSR
jgi:hypothetical protein